MAVNPNEDTEFNDALRMYGIIPPKEPTPPSPSPPPSPTFDDLLNDLTSSELQERSEDAPDDETERMITAYRRQRLAGQRKEDKQARFGRVYPIGRDDYTREVTEASKISEEDDQGEPGTGVVCFLYKDGIPRSDRAFGHIRTLASRYPRTKFVSIVGDKCISNLPDSRVPMFIIYKNGEIRNQVIAWGADRDRQLEELEALLLMTGVLRSHKRPSQAHRDDDSEGEDEDQDPPSLRSSTTSINRKPKKNIRNKTQRDDSDSDFDFDL